MKILLTMILGVMPLITHAETLFTCTHLVPPAEDRVAVYETLTFESTKDLQVLTPATQKDNMDFFEGKISRSYKPFKEGVPLPEGYPKDPEVVLKSPCVIHRGEKIIYSSCGHAEVVSQNPDKYVYNVFTIKHEVGLPDNPIFLRGGPSAPPKLYFTNHYRLELLFRKLGSKDLTLSRRIKDSDCKIGK